MDTALQRLDPLLVTFQSTSICYQESMGDCSTTLYQGVAHITNKTGGWDLDCMSWHQILTDWYSKDGEEMRDHKSAMTMAENIDGLDSQHGQTAIWNIPGSDTNLETHSEATCMSQSNWLLLSAVPPNDMEQWLVTLIKQGGGGHRTPTSGWLVEILLHQDIQRQASTPPLAIQPRSRDCQVQTDPPVAQHTLYPMAMGGR
eukprot:560654-Rhodomonas_salina.2